MKNPKWPMNPRKSFLFVTLVEYVDYIVYYIIEEHLVTTKHFFVSIVEEHLVITKRFSTFFAEECLVAAEHFVASIAKKHLANAKFFWLMLLKNAPSSY